MTMYCHVISFNDAAIADFILILVMSTDCLLFAGVGRLRQVGVRRSTVATMTLSPVWRSVGTRWLQGHGTISAKVIPWHFKL